VTPHPYCEALRARDPEALAASLHADVTFTPPLANVTIHGRDRVLGVFGALASAFEDVEFVDEVAGDGTLYLVVRVRVGSEWIDAVDRVELDGDGLVRSIMVMMRPVATVLALAAHMMQPVLDLLATESADAARDGEEKFRSIPRAADLVRFIAAPRP
jgi:hypothetical protein